MCSLGRHPFESTDDSVKTACAPKGSSTNGASDRVDTNCLPTCRYRIRFSEWFLVLSFVLSASVAHVIGWVVRVALLARSDILLTDPSPNAFHHMTSRDGLPSHFPSNTSNNGIAIGSISISSSFQRISSSQSSSMPVPEAIKGKDIPLTTYTSKVFHETGSATSNNLHIDRSQSVSHGVEENPSSVAKGDEEEDLHLPAGQHLLVDIKNVDPTFLNSEHQLATAMIELINESELTLLSYHCHSLVPIGVSCVGVLLESHVSFHTWPQEGVITLDLFTCGAKPLIPTLPSIERLFAVRSREDEDEMDIQEPAMLWSHKLRGFREEFSPDYQRGGNPLDQELGPDVLGRLHYDLKKQVASVKTKYQNVDIYELIHTQFRSLESYTKSLHNDDTSSYEANNKDLYVPDRVLYLDGVLQSSLYGDAPYHEGLVHPAMISHPNPRRVAIIGGGEGATLREVLKHNTVDEVVMIDIDRELIAMAKEHLPGWNDCSDLVESNEVTSCFDHPKASVYFSDALKWFMDRYGNESNNGLKEREKFDIIIMDALDPNDPVDFVDELYNNRLFIQSLFNGLTDNGAFVVQLGRSPRLKDPSDESGPFMNRAHMMTTLQDLGMESLHIYDEGHSKFTMPWSHLVAFKDYSSRASWYRNAAEIDVQIQKRLHRTKSGRNSLRYFDGSTMASYQVTPKSFETNYCIQENTPIECEDSGSTNKPKAIGYSPLVERQSLQKATQGDHAIHAINVGEKRRTGIFAIKT